MVLEMIKYLKRLFYTSIFGRFYFEFLLWLDRRVAKKETKQYLNNIRIEINATREKYEKALCKIKSKVNEEAKESNHHKVLKVKGDLVSIAEEEEDEFLKKRAEIMKSAIVKKGDKDIKSDTDMAKMVESRINDYKALHKDIAMRQLLRRIRQAEREGDSQLADSLKLELKEKYGRF